MDPERFAICLLVLDASRSLTDGSSRRFAFLQGNKKFGSERGGTPIAEDLSHLSVEERTKYLKERERKIKLIAVAQDRLEKLKTDVEAVTIEDVGVRFEEGREAWEVEGDEGVAGRVELREFFWRVSRVFSFLSSLSFRADYLLCFFTLSVPKFRATTVRLRSLLRRIFTVDRQTNLVLSPFAETKSFRLSTTSTSPSPSLQPRKWA